MLSAAMARRGSSTMERLSFLLPGNVGVVGLIGLRGLDGVDDRLGVRGCCDSIVKLRECRPRDEGR
jgi:hypothetical protein